MGNLGVPELLIIAGLVLGLGVGVPLLVRANRKRARQYPPGHPQQYPPGYPPHPGYPPPPGYPQPGQQMGHPYPGQQPGYPPPGQYPPYQ